MKNYEIYKRTLTLSLRRLGCSLIGLLAFIGFPVLACVLTSNATSAVTVTACGIGLVLGIVVMWLIGHFYTYILEAAQVAMITRGITEGELPQDVVAEGKEAVKRRFATVAVYYALRSATNAIINQVNRGVNAVVDSVSDSKNSTVQTIAAVVQLVISIILTYVNYCCLGWVFYKGDESAVKATLDGAVLYFQNWKALMKNVGKVLLIGTLTLILVAGPVFGVMAAFSGSTPGMRTMGAEIAEFVNSLSISVENDDGVKEPMTVDAETALIFFDILVALIVFGIVYGTLVQPYVLVAFMRGFMEAGIANPPSVSLYDKLAGLSKRFKTEAQKLPANGEA